MCGHDTQVTDQRLKPNTRPHISEPPKRIPSVRPSRNAPSAATNSLSAATTASESQNGRMYAGMLNGENTADCGSPSSERPLRM
jgi:hypothetical protein